MRVLRGVVYMTKSSGPRTEPMTESKLAGCSFNSEKVAGVTFLCDSVCFLTRTSESLRELHPVTDSWRQLNCSLTTNQLQL